VSKKLLDIGEAYEEAISRIATLERELAEARRKICVLEAEIAALKYNALTAPQGGEVEAPPQRKDGE